jgi:hypothetical protein
MPPPQTFKVFCSYAHKDEQLRDALEAHLSLLRREGVATSWSDHDIRAGSDWAGEIDRNLQAANIILLLLSAHFLASPYCLDIELRQAAARHLAREAVVVPVVLRPCDWNSVRVPCEGVEFALGDVQVLPDAARPVTKWGNRDEAYVSVLKGVRAVIRELAGGGGTAPPPARTAAQPPPVPELLPYLCDRAAQEKLLRRAVQAWRASGRTKRPLVCVVHGDDDEGLDMFKRRLQEWTLPEVLAARAGENDEPLYDPASGKLEDLFVQLPTPFVEPGDAFDFLQEEVGIPLLDNYYATPADVAEAISARDTPTLFHSNLSTGDWEGGGERIVEAYMNFWGGLPDVKAGRALCFLFFKYRGVAAGASARVAELNARTEEFFGGLQSRLAGREGFHAVVLPKLPPVSQTDAETWVRNGENFRKARLCRNHPHNFCNVEKAVEDIERMYTDPSMHIPMERLAPQLHAVINNHRCGAAPTS